MDWLYSGPATSVNREEYLLGKKIDRQIDPTLAEDTREREVCGKERYWEREVCMFATLHQLIVWEACLQHDRLHFSLRTWRGDL